MSINAKIKIYLLVIVSFLVVVSAIFEFYIDIQDDLIIWGVHIPAIIVSIVSTTSKFFMGVVVTTWILSFITSRIDAKMEYLHQHYFMPFLQSFRFFEPYSFVNTEDGSKIREGLVRYGKYFGISCYPNDVVKDFEKFCQDAKEHNELLRKLRTISKKRIGKDNITILNGVFGLNLNVNLEGYDPNTVNKYRPLVDYVNQHEPDLIENIKKSNEKMKKAYEIIERFRSFLRENSLKVPEIPSGDLQVLTGKVRYR